MINDYVPQDAMDVLDSDGNGVVNPQEFAAAFDSSSGASGPEVSNLEVSLIFHVLIHFCFHAYLCKHIDDMCSALQLAYRNTEKCVGAFWVAN